MKVRMGMEVSIPYIQFHINSSISFIHSVLTCRYIKEMRVIMPQYPFECFRKGTEVVVEVKGKRSKVLKRWKVESGGLTMTNKCGATLLFVKNIGRSGSGWIRFHQIVYESYRVAHERLQVDLSLNKVEASDSGKDKHAKL